MVRKNKKNLIPAVSSLSELYGKAQTDEQYRRLLFTANENLGGSKTENVQAAYRWLLDNASETSERGVVDEVNFCRDLI